MSKSLVIYHANCYDGFTAAWIAKQAMPRCELFPATYGDEPPNVYDKHVYILDFSYPRETMEKMSMAASTMVVLDHHKTAQADCEGLPYCEFDMERSGCHMAWDFFFPGKEVPDWIACVEDRDLWRFDLDGTKNVHAYIASLPMTLQQWDCLADMAMGDILDGGFAILGYINTSIAKAVEHSRLILFDGHIVAVLNVTRQNASEMADALLKKCPSAHYSMTYFQRGDSRWEYELRSRSELDVSEIAKKFGGGGHAQASGMDTKLLFWTLAEAPDAEPMTSGEE